MAIGDVMDAEKGGTPPEPEKEPEGSADEALPDEALEEAELPDEALEQAELRKRLEEQTAEEQSRRAEAAGDEEASPSEPEREVEEPEWEAPEEATRRGGWAKTLVRVVVFALILVGLWSLLRQASFTIFQPELEALGPVVPDGRMELGDSVTVGVRMANSSLFEGDAFSVVVLGTGQEVQGAAVTIPPGDTVLVPVGLLLPEGDHVLTLVAFATGRETERMESFPGQRLWVGNREIELGDVPLPPTLERSDTLPVEFMATNPGDRSESVVPVFFFETADGSLVELGGPPTEIAPGESGMLRVTVVASQLEPGRYQVRVMARTPEGLRLADEGRLHQVDVGR